MSRRIPAAIDAEHVLDVEPPAQRRLDVDTAGAETAPAAPTTSSSGRISAASVSPNVTSGARRASASSSGEPPPVLVADVDRCRRRLGAGEQPALRLVVVLHRPVQVEMVLARGS